MRRCPPDGPSFRQLQCSHFNPMPYKGKLYKWTPVPNNSEWRAESSSLGMLRHSPFPRGWPLVCQRSLSACACWGLCLTPWLGLQGWFVFGEAGAEAVLLPSEPLRAALPA